jgi:hypothetical protein
MNANYNFYRLRNSPFGNTAEYKGVYVRRDTGRFLSVPAPPALFITWGCNVSMVTS